MTQVCFVQEAYYEYAGVMTMAALVKQHGHQCRVFIGPEERNLAAAVAAASPDLIAFSCTAYDARWALRTAAKLREALSVPVIFGGASPTFYPDIIEHPAVDIVCRGEGEYALLDLLDSLEQGRDYSNTANLWVKEGGAIHRNEVRPLIPDLNALPVPDWDVYYRYPVMRANPCRPFIFGRGCPYPCTFCANPQYMELYRRKGKFIRRVTVDRAFAEMLEVKRAYGLERAYLRESTFTCNRRWALEFLRRYPREVGVPFVCYARADELDSEVVRALANAGCEEVGFGIESGAPHIRNAVLGKKLDDEDIYRAAALLHVAGIRVSTFNMVGMPGETIDDALQTVVLNQRIKADLVWTAVLQLYPETHVARMVPNQRKPTDDSRPGMGFQAAIVDQPNMRELLNTEKLLRLAVALSLPSSVLRILVRLPLGWLYGWLSDLSFYLMNVRRRTMGFRRTTMLTLRSPERGKDYA